MSEIYKRSMGMTFDERALEIEVSNGMGSYDMTPTDEGDDDELQMSVVTDDFQERAWAIVTQANSRGITDLHELIPVAAQEVDEAEEAYEQRKVEFNQLAANEEGAIYIELLAEPLIADLRERQANGQPIDDTFYQEARDMVDEIVIANPDMSHSKLTQAVDALVQLQFAERELIAAERILVALAA